MQTVHINQLTNSISQLTLLVFKTDQGSQGLGRMHVAHAAMPMCPAECVVTSTAQAYVLPRSGTD